MQVYIFLYFFLQRKKAIMPQFSLPLKEKALNDEIYPYPFFADLQQQMQKVHLQNL